MRAQALLIEIDWNVCLSLSVEKRLEEKESAN